MTESILPKAIFNTQKADYSVPKIILGEAPGLLDSIHNHHPQLYSIYKRLRKLDWDELEFDFSSCMLDFETCDKSTYDMMFKTLIWQWEADSIASRSIASVLAPVVTDSRVWAAYLRITENECKRDGTECLTPRGWVDLGDLTESDLVMQYDSQTKVMSFVKPTAYIEKDFKGNLIEFKNHQRHFWQVATPGHRMIRQSLKTGEVDIGTADNFVHKRGAADMLWSAPSTGFVLDGERGTLNPIERLLLAIENDGSIHTVNMANNAVHTVNHISVGFHFSKKRKIKRLRKLANDANWTLRALKGFSYTSNGNKTTRLVLEVPLDFKPYLKNLDWVELGKINGHWCRDFLEEIIEWDGHWSKNCGMVGSTNKSVIEKIQAIASMGGYRTHMSIREDHRSETFNDIYNVTWKDFPYVSGQGIDKTLVPYEGKVRCVTVPTGLFLIRYNGAVSVTGNCVHALTYSEIVRNSFVNPDLIIGEIMEVREAQERMVVVANAMDRVQKATYAYGIGQRANDQSMFNDVFVFLIALYMLERIQFMASFAITFAICKTGLFQPIGHAVKKIAQDEFEIHAQYGQGVIRVLLKTPQGAIALKECKPEIVKLFVEVLRTETTWVKYLFSEGRSLAGINAKKINDWTLFNANAAKTFIGITDAELADFGVEFKELTGDDLVFPTVNPLPYMEDYLDISGSQGSPQEEKSKSDYQVNLLDNRDEAEVFVVDF